MRKNGWEGLEKMDEEQKEKLSKILIYSLSLLILLAAILILFSDCFGEKSPAEPRVSSPGEIVRKEEERELPKNYESILAALREPLPEGRDGGPEDLSPASNEEEVPESESTPASVSRSSTAEKGQELPQSREAPQKPFEEKKSSETEPVKQEEEKKKEETASKETEEQPKKETEKETEKGTQKESQKEAQKETEKKEKTLSGWVLRSQVPAGAEIREEKWLYDLKETVTSTESARPGWTLTGEEWQETGSGSLNYCAERSLFLSSHWVAGMMVSSEKEMKGYEKDSVKRVTTDAAFAGYVYFHWIYPNEEETAGPLIPNIERGMNSEGRACISFYAFLGGDYPAASVNGESLYLVSDRSSQGESGGSYYWYRTPYQSCSYTDYVKSYSFERITADLESTVKPQGAGVENLRHYVRYLA